MENENLLPLPKCDVLCQHGDIDHIKDVKSDIASWWKAEILCRGCTRCPVKEREALPQIPVQDGLSVAVL